MNRPNKNAGLQPGDVAELRRTLHLVADSAIDAEDAITRNDTDGLNRAIAALARNAGTAQALALAWRAAQ